MRKRGQETGVFKTVFIAIIAMLILFVGHKAIGSMSDAACRSGSVSFGIDVASLGEGMRFGSVSIEEFDVPCNAEKVFFVDTTKQADGSLLKSAPLIRDSIEDGTAENVFLASKSGLQGAFQGGAVEIGYPHYLCMKPRHDKVSLFVKSLGNKILLTQGCDVADCTEIPVTPSSVEARNLIDEFVDFGYSGECDGCPGDTSTEYRNYMKSKNDVEIYRRYTYCSQTGLTKVEIIIRSDKKLENFYLYEQIPKECVSSLETYLTSVEGEVTIKDDPLMMWHFDKIKEEETVSYTLKKELSENCKKLIEGLGLERLEEAARQERSCQGTDASCGTYPSCENCNAKDGYTGNPYCKSNSIIRNYADYSCQSNRCTSTTSQKAIKQCDNSQTCQNGNCIATTPPETTTEATPPDEPTVPEPEQTIPEPADPLAPTCSDECQTPGQKQCIGNYAQTCFTNAEGCLQWNTGTYCEYGCSSGTCGACSPDCSSWTDECTESMPDACGSTCTRSTEGNTCQSASGVCKSGSCCVTTSWSPSPSTICSGETFTQVSNCDTTRQSTGTKSCGPTSDV